MARVRKVAFPDFFRVPIDIFRFCKMQHTTGSHSSKNFFLLRRHLRPYSLLYNYQFLAQGRPLRLWVRRIMHDQARKWAGGPFKFSLLRKFYSDVPPPRAVGALAKQKWAHSLKKVTRYFFFFFADSCWAISFFFLPPPISPFSFKGIFSFCSMPRLFSRITDDASFFLRRRSLFFKMSTSDTLSPKRRGMLNGRATKGKKSWEMHACVSPKNFFWGG